MLKTDTDWIKEQLIQNKTKKIVGNAVIKLLDAWEGIKEEDGKNSQEILEIFTKLASGHALVKINKKEVWVQAQSGNLKVADIIRVRSDAFDVASGKSKLNGRRGKVVAVRYGDIIMKTNDEKLPVLDGQHFRPENLERLV